MKEDRILARAVASEVNLWRKRSLTVNRVWCMPGFWRELRDELQVDVTGVAGELGIDHYQVVVCAYGPGWDSLAMAALATKYTQPSPDVGRTPNAIVVFVEIDPPGFWRRQWRRLRHPEYSWGSLSQDLYDAQFTNSIERFVDGIHVLSAQRISRVKLMM